MAARGPRRHRRDERHGSERRAQSSSSAIGPWLPWLALVAVVIGGLIYVLNMTSQGLSPEQKLAQAKTLIETKRVDDAITLLRGIDKSAGESYDEAQKLLRQYLRKREARQERLAPPDPASVFEVTVLPYYDTHLKGTSNDTLDRARVQYFVEWRAKPYIKRFPDSDKTATINRMVDYYKPLMAPPDRSFPETFHDAQIVAEGERDLSHFGEAYRVVTEWLSLHGNSSDAGDAKKLADQCVTDAKHHLDKEKERAWRYANDQYFETAKRTLKDVADNCRGITQVVSDVDAELARITALEEGKGSP
jgi:hypothetical protein